MDFCSLKEKKHDCTNFKSRLGPDGLHLFNRKTGTNILFDELSIDPDRWSKAPRQVSIALTNACDLQCTHCYAPKQKSSLNSNVLASWLHTLDQNGCMGIGFGGGEPTLYPNFLDICDYASNKTSLAVTMTTHAHRLHESILEKLAGNIHFARVSMDGVYSTYEKIRGRPFNQLLEKIHLLGKIVPFGVNYVVNTVTIGDLDEAAKIAEGLGASELLLLPEVPVGRGVSIDDATRNNLKEWMRRYSGNLRLAISELHGDDLPICEPFPMENGISAYAHIDAAGILKTSSFDFNGVLIEGFGIMKALEKLRTSAEGAST